MKKSNVFPMCAMALLIAMMILLKSTIAIETPYFKFSFASLPILLAAMMFGPLKGTAVAIIGELVMQVVGPYGLMPTTIIWIWPPAVRALVVGSTAVWVQKHGRNLEDCPALCYGAFVIGAVLTTTGNTFGMWLESLMYQTSFTAALFFVPGRYISGILTAVLMATICIPIMRIIRRSSILIQ